MIRIIRSLLDKEWMTFSSWEEQRGMMSFPGLLMHLHMRNNSKWQLTLKENILVSMLNALEDIIQILKKSIMVLELHDLGTYTEVC